jgi:hypothetical protein
MNQPRSVRACPICSENNAAYAVACRICGEALDGVAPQHLSARDEQPLLGTPERAIVGAGLSLVVAAVLLRDSPAAAIPLSVLLRVERVDNELAHLPDLFTHPSFALILACGIVGATLAALAALMNGWNVRELALAPSRRKPCPRCAEMVQSAASVCRYCAHALDADAPRGRIGIDPFPG